MCNYVCMNNNNAMIVQIKHENSKNYVLLGHFLRNFSLQNIVHNPNQR